MIGAVVVDKAAGMTSHDVVARLRRRLGERRIGHAGTLDPPVTGVLVCAVGRATRLLRFVTELPKSYCGEIVFGTTTTTLDDAGDVVRRFEMPSLTATEVQAAAAKLTGDIEQVPPMVSAVKVGGRRLHELARRGEVVERDPRPVSVHRFDVEPTADPLVYTATVDCSSGTYVRTLADDLGQLVGGGAHLRTLRRTAIGSFMATDALPVDEAEVLPPAALVREMTAVVLADDEARRVGNGVKIDRPDDGDGPWALFGPAETLLAVYDRRGDFAAPVVVLS